MKKPEDKTKEQLISENNQLRAKILELERPESEEEQKRISSDWKTTFDAMTDSVCIIDLEGNFITCNSATFPLLNITEEDLKNKKCHQLVHGTSQPYPNCPIERMKKSKKHESMIFQENDKWYEVMIDPIFNDKKQLSGAVHVISDITERKRVENNLIESEQKLSDLLNNMDVGVVVHAADTSIVLSNPRATEILGLTIEQMHGKQAIDPDWMFIEEGNKPLSLENYPVNRIIKDKEPIKNMSLGVVRPKTQDVAWVLANGFPVFDDQGDVVEVIINFIDITEHKKAEETVLQEKNKAQQYLDIADVMLLSLDADGIIQLINPKGCEILAYAKEEILGQNWFDLALPESQREMVKEVAKKVFSGEMEAVKYYENNIITKLGEERLIAFHNSVLHDESGNIIGTLSSGEDISEKRKIQDHLAESKAFNETLLNTSPDVIYVYDVFENRNIYSNEGISRVLGYSTEEIKDLGDKLISSLMHEDDFVVYINETLPRYQNAKDGEIISHEYRMKHKNGDWHWLHSKESIFQRMDDGSPKQIFGMISNVTERKLMEEELHKSKDQLDLAMKGADAGLWSWNIKTGEDLLDERWCGILGYKMEEVKQHVSSWENMIHPDDKERIYEVVNKHFEDEKNEYRDEYRMKCKNGDWKWILALGKTVERDEENNPARMAGIIIDIDKQKQAEEELAEQSSRMASIVEGTNAGTWEWNIQTGEVEFNERWAEIMGYSLKDLEPFDINTWINNVHPDDLPMANAALEKNFNKELDYFDVVFRQPHKDGSWVWVNARGKIVEWSENGKPLRMSGTHLDITDRKKAELELAKHRDDLEKLVSERTNELEKRNVDLDNALKVFVGRESKIKLLQDEINRLKHT